MATQSSIPAWKILWTEEPGGLQSMGSRVRQNLATKPYITHLKLRLKPKFLSRVVIQNKL